MRAIYNDSTDPYFNLASDEYILTSSEGDVFMIWQNSRAVIIGKNQNAWAEIDLPFIEREKIPVVRRITGGGAVFHDLGNVNFSFVTKNTDDSRLNFDKFTRPIVSYLRSVGIDAALDGRNDIVAEGFKISGNAQCCGTNFRGESVVLHHGTLLFSADLGALAGALKVSKDKLRGKGIKSVSSRVKNISSYDTYRGPKDVKSFMKEILDCVAPEGTVPFSPAERDAIDELKNKKFSTWEWNWGTSPSFENTLSRRFPFGTLEASFTCRDGAIEIIKFAGDFFGAADVSLLEDALAGTRFERTSLADALDANRETLEKSVSGAAPDDIVSLFFD